MRSTSALPQLFFFFLFFLFYYISISSIASATTSAADDPIPKAWPEKFHALLYMNFTSTGTLYVTHNYYDWPNNRNFNMMGQQLSDVLYDVEWGNGTSFYFTATTCYTLNFDVGIVRPDFLSKDATYLGRQHADGFLCDVWEKEEFLWYYEDVESRRPVRWDFFDGISTHVMTWEEGVVLEDSSQLQAPSHCFNQELQQVKGQNTIMNINQHQHIGLSRKMMSLLHQLEA